MPSIVLVTNHKLGEDEAKKFILELSAAAAEILGKPLKYISSSYTYNPTLAFGGTHEPAFHLDVGSLGNINPDDNLVYSKKFSEFLGKKLGLPNDRGYINFVDPGNSFYGYQGTTFGEIFGSK